MSTGGTDGCIVGVVVVANVVDVIGLVLLDVGDETTVVSQSQKLFSVIL